MGNNVLVLDKDDDQRWSYKEELEKKDYNVFITTSPKLALRYIQMFGVDIIIMDMAFVDSGLEALWYIVNLIKPKIVIHSDHPEIDYNFLPPDDFIRKSSDLSTLKNTLNKLR